jgi:2-isopropylmalate synthase
LRVRIYDATLTEGTRAAGIHFSARDKLRIAFRLAELGAAWVEAGWPGRPGEAEVFRAARGLTAGEARLCACAEVPAKGRSDDGGLAAALRSGAPTVTLFASAWSRRPGGGARAVQAVGSAIRRVRAAGREALVDLGDFFDAHREAPVLAVAAVAAAARAGAEAILLSDTLGGALPGEVEAGVAAARKAAGRAAVGVRARNDAGLAVACSLAAVARGATVVAGTVNGYGERCGAADLVAVIAGLELKLGRRAVREGQLRHLAGLAHFVAELADQQPPRGQPYVGRDAFPDATEEGKGEALHHVDPGAVGNRPEPAMTDARGHPRALWLARELGLVPRGAGGTIRVVKRLAEWERRGFRYEGAEASFDLVLRELAGRRRSYFRVLAHRVLDHLPSGGHGFTEATVEVAVGGEVVHAAALGVGPVHALDQALHRALEPRYPELKEVRLVDARSRNLPGLAGSEAAARVLVESTDGRDYWGTAGVSENLLDAVTQAIADAIEYKLVKDDVAVPARARRSRR